MILLRAAIRQAFIGLVSLASVVTVFSYFGNYDPPVSFMRAEASKSPIYAGGVMTINWEVERSRRCYTTFDHHIVDGRGKRWTLTDVVREGGLPVSSRDVFSTELGIPVKAAPGPAKYISTALYSCNLWQRIKPIVVPAPEVDFVIQPAPAVHGAFPARLLRHLASTGPL